MSIIIVSILLSILASAFFSGIEIAYVSANKFHIEIENKKGKIIYQLISYLSNKPSKFIAAMLVGNNIALVVYGILMPKILDQPFTFISNEYVMLLVQTIISTIIILFLAEFLPKALFSAHSNKLLEVFAIPSSFFYFLFFPIVSFMIGISNFVIKYLFKVELSSVQTVFNKIDLDNYIRERSSSGSKQEEDSEVQIFRNALEFNERKAREFMIPRTEIIGLDANEPIETLKETFIKSSLSKLLIYKESIDSIVGYAHAFELFKKPRNIRSILRPVAFIPESMVAKDILDLLTRERRSIAIVLDEFGGTSGLVTIEDVIEEIFGEIDDEHDTEELLEHRLSEDEFIFSARQEIDYLNEEYDLHIPEAESYSTLGGFIIQNIERIPERGEQFNIDNFSIHILETSVSRIEKVQLSLKGDV